MKKINFREVGAAAERLGCADVLERGLPVSQGNGVTHVITRKGQLCADSTAANNLSHSVSLSVAEGTSWCRTCTRNLVRFTRFQEHDPWSLIMTLLHLQERSRRLLSLEDETFSRESMEGLIRYYLESQNVLQMVEGTKPLQRRKALRRHILNTMRSYVGRTKELLQSSDVQECFAARANVEGGEPTLLAWNQGRDASLWHGAYQPLASILLAGRVFSTLQGHRAGVIVPEGTAEWFQSLEKESRYDKYPCQRSRAPETITVAETALVLWDPDEESTLSALEDAVRAAELLHS